MKASRTTGCLLAAGSLFALAACSSSSTTTPKTPASSAADKSITSVTAGTTAKPASITIVANSLPSGLDPDAVSSTDSAFEQLVTFNDMGMLYSLNGATAPDGTVPALKPDLATSSDTSADGLTVTYHLRSGVKSSLGNPLTSADVVWTLKRVEAAKVNGSSLLSQANVDPANPATAIDPLTVAIHLTHPSALVTPVLALPYLGIIDATAAMQHVTAKDPYATTWLNANNASFGPYKVASFTASTTFVLEANPNYWAGEPQVTKATYRTVQDASTALQTALTGQSDYTISLPAADLATLQKSSALTVHQQPTPNVVYLTLDVKNPELTDPRVREAIALATDRTAIDQTVYAGTAKPVTGCLPSDLTSGTALTTPNDNAASPEIAKAKALLAQVPGTHSLTIGTLPTVFADGATISRIVQSNLEAIGMNVTLKTYSAFGPIVAAAKAHAIGSLVLENGPFIPDAGYFFKAFFLSTSPYNYSSYASTAFDTAANTAMQEQAPARNASIATACALFTKDAPADVLVEAPNVMVTKKNITGVTTTSDESPRLFNLHVG